MSELLKLLPDGVLELKDVLYFCLIGFVITFQRIKAARQTHCPSHKYMLSGINWLKRHSRWNARCIRAIALKLDVKLDPEPEEKEPN